MDTLALMRDILDAPRAVMDTCGCSGCRANLARYREEFPAGCPDCGYAGQMVANACCCYDTSCSTSAVGSGCPHGSIACPVCDNLQGEVDPWAIIKLLRTTLDYAQGRLSGDPTIRCDECVEEAIGGYPVMGGITMACLQHMDHSNFETFAQNADSVKRKRQALGLPPLEADK